MPSLADLRHTLRQLRRAPAFTLTTVLILALGIGANTAVFSLIHQVMLRRLPVQRPGELFKLGKDSNCCVWGGFHDSWNIFPYDAFRYLQQNAPAGTSLLAVQAGANTVSVQRANDPGSAQTLAIRFVSGNYFSTLGVHTFAGRLLRPEDDTPAAPPALVLSYRLWQTAFAADPSLVGSTLVLTGHPVTVVGIAAPTFLGERNVAEPPGLWLPLAAEPTFDPDRQLLHNPSNEWLDLLIRLPHPQQSASVSSALSLSLRQWLSAHHEAFGTDVTPAAVARQEVELAPASTGINALRDQYGPGLKILLLVAAFVLLIACANLANLLLVRGLNQQSEFAVRLALGAPRSRLLGQTLREALVLALTGGALSLLVAFGLTRAMLSLVLHDAPGSTLSATPSWPVLGFSFVASLAAALLFGLAPAWFTSRTAPGGILHSSRGSTSDRGSLFRRSLVVLQATLALVLLSTAGLFLSSLSRLEHQNFHIEPEGRLILTTDLPAAGYTADRLPLLYAQLTDHLAHLPGVLHVGFATYSAMTEADWNTGIYFPADSPRPSTSIYDAVSPHFFEALGTPLLLGRSISEHDTSTSTHVAVVNRAFADKFFPGRSPIGEHFGPDPSLRQEFEIVGVVDNARFGSPSEAPRPMYFSSLSQITRFPSPDDAQGETALHLAHNLVIHYQGDPASMAAAVRAALHTVDPRLPVLRLISYRDQLVDNFIGDELIVRLSAAFAALALLLAALGLYGTTAYAVTRRTPEIGIRIALGASTRSVLALILRGALAQVLFGVILGIPLSLLVGRLVAHTLFETPAVQPTVLLAVTGLLTLAAAAAALLPARRAAAVDPIVALRNE